MSREEEYRHGLQAMVGIWWVVTAEWSCQDTATDISLSQNGKTVLNIVQAAHERGENHPGGGTGNSEAAQLSRRL